MASEAIGSALSSAAILYDFTSMTSKQASDAAKDLFNQGKLTADEAGRLEGAAFGIDYVPVDRTQVSTAHTLADPTKVNWVAYMQQSADWMHSSSGTKGVEGTDALLKELKSYQADSLAESAKTISTRA